VTEKLVALYLAGLLRDIQCHRETHLLDKMELLGHVVILDEKSEGMFSKITGSELKMLH